jgi:hypothetical protein
MDAYDKTELVRLRVLAGCGVKLAFDDAQTLRRAARTLRRWYEAECGDSSGVVFRGPGGKPYKELYSGGSVSVRDMESGAVRRLQEVCTRYGLSYKISHDPRGGVLYVTSPALSLDYSFGVPVDV